VKGGCFGSRPLVFDKPPRCCDNRRPMQRFFFFCFRFFSLRAKKRKQKKGNVQFDAYMA